MSIMASFLLLAVFILLYTAIIEIFTILFRLTGLTREKARTQVISLLTNSGFTTSESEIILSAHKRRMLAQITMLFGYSFTVIIVSTIVNVFLSLSRTEVSHLLPAVLVLAGLVLLVFVTMCLPPVRSAIDHVIERIGNRIMFGKHSNPVVLVDMYSGKAVAEVLLEHVPGRLAGVPLGRTGLREEMDLHILHIKRGEEETVRLDGDTTLLPGDNLLLFGNYKNIRAMFERPQHVSPPTGDATGKGQGGKKAN